MTLSPSPAKKAACKTCKSNLSLGSKRTSLNLSPVKSMQTAKANTFGLNI
jgi:hypothetical protein